MISACILILGQSNGLGPGPYDLYDLGKGTALVASQEELMILPGQKRAEIPRFTLYTHLNRSRSRLAVIRDLIVDVYDLTSLRRVASYPGEGGWFEGNQLVIVGKRPAWAASKAVRFRNLAFRGMLRAVDPIGNVGLAFRNLKQGNPVDSDRQLDVVNLKTGRARKLTVGGDHDFTGEEARILRDRHGTVWAIAPNYAVGRALGRLARMDARGKVTWWKPRGLPKESTAWCTDISRRGGEVEAIVYSTDRSGEERHFWVSYPVASGKLQELPQGVETRFVVEGGEWQLIESPMGPGQGTLKWVPATH